MKTRDEAGQLTLLDPWPLRERISSRAYRIRVDVRRNGEVVLTIPRRMPRHHALRFLEQSRPWIERTRARILAHARPAPRLRWDGSDTISLRGMPTALRIERGGRRGVVVPGANAIVLRVAPARVSDARYLMRLLLGFLREQALADGRRLLDEESARLGLRDAGLTVRDARSRWGSCGPDGRIMLSLRLVLAPPEVFRYVVVHELCHLRWRGHGPRFWGLVARQMPEFEVHRAWLRRHGENLGSELIS